MTYRRNLKSSFRKLLLISLFIFLMTSCDDCDADFPFYSLFSSRMGEYHLLYSAFLKSFWIFPGDEELLAEENCIFNDSNIHSRSFNPFSFSHDGKYLAYPGEKTGNREIVELNFENLETKIITSHPAQDDLPRYSPDGKFLAFISYRSGSAQIWLLDRTSNKLKQITNEEDRIDELQFLDDHSIVFKNENYSSLYCLSLRDNSKKIIIENAYIFRCYPEHGIIVYIHEDCGHSDCRSLCSVYDVHSKTSRNLEHGNEPGFASINLPVSPDGKYLLLSGEHDIRVLSIKDGTAFIFSPPVEDDGSWDTLSTLAWMPDSRSFRYFLLGAQFKGNIEDEGRELVAQDQSSLGILAIADLQKGRDRDFIKKAEILPAYPKTLMIDDSMDMDYVATSEEVQFVSKLLANDFKEASNIFINDESDRKKEIAVLLDILESDSKQVISKIDIHVKELEENHKEDLKINKWKKLGQLYESLNWLQKRQFKKLLEILIKESYIIDDVEYFGEPERKISSDMKKVERYVKFHPSSPISGKLCFRLAEIFGNYEDPDKAEKYYRISAKDKDLRLNSLKESAGILKKKEDSEKMIEIYHTIINEFPDTEDAHEERLNAGINLIEKNESDRAFDFLYPLVLEGCNSESWLKIKENSQEIFKGLVLAEYSEEYYNKTRYLAEITLYPWPESGDTLLIDVAGIIDDKEIEKTYQEYPNSISSAENILEYCYLNNPEGSIREFDFFRLFYYLRKYGSTQDTWQRWKNYSEKYPGIANSYPYLLLQGLLSYDKKEYKSANEYFKKASSVLDEINDSCGDKSRILFRLSIINLAYYDSDMLVQNISLKIKPEANPYESSEIKGNMYLYYLSSYANKRPKEEIKDFVKAAEAVQEFKDITPFRVLEFKTTESEAKNIAEGFIEKYPRSPLSGVILYELKRYEEILQRFPESLAGKHALLKRIKMFDRNKNYWLAANARKEFLKHPLIEETERSNTIYELCEYEILRSRNEKKMIEYYEMLLKMDPTRSFDDEYIKKIAEAYKAAGRPEKAAEILNRMNEKK